MDEPGHDIVQRETKEPKPTLVTIMIRSLLCFCVLHFSLNTVWVFAQSDSGGKSRWMLVTTAELEKEFEPLVLRRQQQGFEVGKVFRDGQIQDSDWNAEFIRNKISQSHESDRSIFVLLAGDGNDSDKNSYVPLGKGKQGRMRNASTDHAYGLPNERGVPSVAVGRIPVRTAEDVKRFVAKVIRYEDQSIGAWTNRLNLWVGHPGGNSVLEKRLGEVIVQSAVNQSLNQLNLAWTGSCLVDFPNTPYSVDRKTFGERMRNDLTQGQCFTIYAGHSAAEGIWSEDRRVFDREGWERVKIQSSPGVVLTTGCFSCQMSGKNGKGFVATSVLNPDGPVAGIGAYAESYAALGQLAMDAFVGLVARPKPPTLLGDYWLSVAQGLGSGKMDPLTFWLYDQADGSRGATSLDQQRLEHLEMWTLLGDPALKIPFLEPTLDIDVKAAMGSSEVVIEFDLPENLIGGTCQVQVRFRPKIGSQVSRPVISTHRLEAKRRFTATISDFKQLSAGELLVRVFADKNGHGVLGISSVSLK